MASDDRAYTVDYNFAIELLESRLNEICNRSCVFLAGRVTYITLARIILTSLGKLRHLFDDSGDDLLLGADLLAGDQS